eukprot:CAMPEP_0184977806 /NCGR_PEP_ID=MMETSP1098-20130426/8463_1 /TAXON_ID=89044 /ORGANISM="Spumella elongata, Strain CCAP 955/1" /LENGTH=44 /DNA_ID= /DNA_START= /DNA_END= /DNA_ORIENTATION=
MELSASSNDLVASAGLGELGEEEDAEGDLGEGTKSLTSDIPKGT